MSHERKFFLEEEQQKQWMLAYLHENLDPTQIDRVRRMVQSATVAVLEYNPALVRAKVHILDGKRDFIPEGGLDLLGYLLAHRPRDGVHLVSNHINIHPKDDDYQEQDVTDLDYFTQRGMTEFNSVVNPLRGVQTVMSMHYQYPLDYGMKYEHKPLSKDYSTDTYLNSAFHHLTTSLYKEGENNMGLYVGVDPEFCQAAINAGFQTINVDQSGIVTIHGSLDLSDQRLSLRDIALLCKDGNN